MERNKQVDIIRGVAILLVVLEHALGTSDNFFAKIILSFHMPVFFILSGYLAHEKITGNFGAVIKKKIKRLLIPQLTLAILSLLYNFFIGKLVLHTATAEELSIFYCFFRWWFLLVMAQVVIAWEVLTRICKNYLIEAESIIKEKSPDTVYICFPNASAPPISPREIADHTVKGVSMRVVGERRPSVNTSLPVLLS